jgi:4-hydroxy-tetrahydrodipicolinate synthase
MGASPPGAAARPLPRGIKKQKQNENASATSLKPFDLPVHPLLTTTRTPHPHPHPHPTPLPSLITAIKTPYLPNGKIDLAAYDKLVALQVAGGADALVIGGTTGEGHLMSWDEHVMLIAHTVNAFGGGGSGSGGGKRLGVIGNTGSNATREALHATEQGFAVGMDAALHVNPYYGKTSAAGLLTHFSAVLDEGPAILYNVPGRTGQDIPDEVVLALKDHPSFLGVKECTGNARIASYAAAGVRCWSGNDDEAHDAVHGGSRGAGAISVASNLLPGAFAALLKTRDDATAAALQPLIAWLFCEPNPIAVNTALAMCGLVRPVFRLPYVPLSRAQREEGAVLLRAVQHLLPGVDRIEVLNDDDFVLVSRY